MAIKNKKEIEIFYKTHNLSPKETAKHFNISYRTLAHWIAKEGWVQGAALENIACSPVSLAKTDKIIDINQAKIKSQIKQNLGSSAYEIDELVLNNLLESSSDELLLKTMNLNFIHKNIALSAVVAKDALMRLLAISSDKDSPMVIAAAEKVVKIFIDMQSAIYGKNITISNTTESSIDSLSTAELAQLIVELEKEGD